MLRKLINIIEDLLSGKQTLNDVAVVTHEMLREIKGTTGRETYVAGQILVDIEELDYEVTEYGKKETEVLESARKRLEGYVGFLKKELSTEKPEQLPGL